MGFVTVHGTTGTRVSFLADSGPWPIGDLLFAASLKDTKNKTTLRSILPVPSPSCFLAPERFLETMPVTMKGSVPSPTKVLCAPTPSTPYLTGTKSPPPARRTPYHLDDPQYDAERIPQYLALQEEELTLAKSKQEAEKASRVEANALFKARQEALMAAQAADKERVKMLRQDALEQSLANLAGLSILTPSRAVSGSTVPFMVQTSGAVTRVDFFVIRDGVEVTVRCGLAWLSAGPQLSCGAPYLTINRCCLMCSWARPPRRCTSCGMARTSSPWCSIPRPCSAVAPSM